MNKLSAIIGTAIMLTFCACSDSDSDNNPGNIPPAQPQWHLEWEEDFNGSNLDTDVWSPIPAGTPDWQVYQSGDMSCIELRDGMLVLKGKVNEDTSTDTRPYICGGVWTKGKKAFEPGRIVVRARLGKGAQGAWPAIWMMPFSNSAGWPECGEIDIMERINYENRVYQTVHSKYVDVLGNRNNPQYSITPSITPNDFHEFEVRITEDMVVFAIDGLDKLTYPKVNDGANGQFPFYQDWDLRLDMQLGGSWVGRVLPSTLPVEMEVDWVKYYKYY